MTQEQKEQKERAVADAVFALTAVGKVSYEAMLTLIRAFESTVKAQSVFISNDNRTTEQEAQFKYQAILSHVESQCSRASRNLANRLDPDGDGWEKVYEKREEAQSTP